ncbi:MAG: PfkB family carbohydrate kinase, partial [Spirochaetales bacterium]
MKKDTRYALCIGHLSYDLTLPLDSFPEENLKYQFDNTFESSGGPAANAAALLSQWGIPTFFLGVAGMDTWGERAVEDLSRSGVDVSGIERSSASPTPFSIILVNTQTGSRTIL